MQERTFDSAELSIRRRFAADIDDAEREALKALAEDISTNGLQRPIIVDMDLRVVDGARRLRAIRSPHYTGPVQVPCVQVDNVEELIEAVKDVPEFHPKTSSRRIASFWEDIAALRKASLNPIRVEASRRARQGLPPRGGDRYLSRERVAQIFGMSGSQFARHYLVLNWAYKDPARRFELLYDYETGRYSIHETVRRTQNRGRQQLNGPTVHPEEQLAILQGVARSMEAIARSMEKLGPLTVSKEATREFLASVLKSRGLLTTKINTIKKGLSA